MTIIAYCAATDRCFVDSKYTYDNGLKPLIATKVRRKRDYVYASACVAGFDEIIMEQVFLALDAGVTAFRCDLIPGESSIHAYIRAPDRRVWMCCFDAQTKLGTVELAAPAYVPWAQGSGAAWAYAYRALDYSVEESVRLVAAHHAQCGLPLEVY